MGLYAYLMEPIKVPKSLQEQTNGKEIERSGNLYKIFEDFVFEKIKVTTKEQMAEKMNISVQELNERTEYHNQQSDYPLPDYPLRDTFYYLQSKEISFMGVFHPIEDWYINLHCTTWTSKRNIEIIMSIIEKEEDRIYFQKVILNNFIEGKHYLTFE